LNISLAKGHIKNIPEIQTVVSDDGSITYLVKSYTKKDEGFTLSWKKISEKDKKDIEDKFTITTDDFIQLKNTDKRFFCIDEFNRCPPVIMNLFYGLMTGEIIHEGEGADPTKKESPAEKKHIVRRKYSRRTD